MDGEHQISEADARENLHRDILDLLRDLKRSDHGVFEATWQIHRDLPLADLADGLASETGKTSFQDRFIPPGVDPVSLLETGEIVETALRVFSAVWCHLIANPHLLKEGRRLVEEYAEAMDVLPELGAHMASLYEKRYGPEG